MLKALPVSRIPAEIFDHIFSFLQSDPTSLAECSRAHPILSPLAERFLYADIVLSETRSDNRTKSCTFSAAELHELFTESPHIANYVRNLEIRLPIEGHTVGIAQILSILSQLRSIALVSTRIYPHYSYCWPELPSEFRDAFTNSLQSSISSVSVLSFARFPLRVFDSCKTVKSITLAGSTDIVGLQDMPQFQLDSLSLHKWCDTQPEFLAWAKKRIHNLRSLSLDSAYGGVIDELLPELVRTCSNSLRSLALIIFQHCDTKFNADGTIASPRRRINLDLSSVPHLKCMTFGTYILVQSLGRYDCAFPAIIELLQTTLHLPKLILNFDIFGYEVPATAFFDLIDWSPLLSSFPRSIADSGHVELHLSFRNSIGQGYVVTADVLPGLFHSEIALEMVSKGTLDIILDDVTVSFQILSWQLPS